jgi:hypothetical protein
VRFERTIRPDGRARLLTHLPPDLARRYAELVGRVAPAVERSLPPGVVANRVRLGPGLVVEPVTLARARLRSVLRVVEGPGRDASIVRSDVRDCYASIGLEAIAGSLVAARADPSAADAILRLLGRLHGCGVRGLPVGPPPSAVLANAVLAHADRAIASAGVGHARWVDDVVLFAGSAGEARRALDAWRRALGEVGLEASITKTAFGVPRDRLARWAGSPVG